MITNRTSIQLSQRGHARMHARTRMRTHNVSEFTDVIMNQEYNPLYMLNPKSERKQQT